MLATKRQLRKRPLREAEDRPRAIGKHIRAAGLRDELLLQVEVAFLLKTTVRTVVRWQQDGVLPFVRMGHAVRFYWPAVLEHLIANYTVCARRGVGMKAAGCSPEVGGDHRIMGTKSWGGCGTERLKAE